jgi:hypothetical protein
MSADTPRSMAPTGRPDLFELLDAAAEFGAWLSEQEQKEMPAVSRGGDAASTSKQGDTPKRATYGQA